MTTSRSPDGAQRNPGTVVPAFRLRSMRATALTRTSYVARMSAKRDIRLSPEQALQILAPRRRHIGIAGGNLGHVAEPGEGQMGAGDQEPVGRGDVEHAFAARNGHRLVRVERERPFRLRELQRRVVNDVAPEQEVAALRRDADHAVAHRVSVRRDDADPRQKLDIVLEHRHLAGIPIGLDRIAGDLEERFRRVRRLPVDLLRGPEPYSASLTCTSAFGNATFLSTVSRPAAWSGCMCVRITASMALASTPPAARFFAMRPKVGAYTFEVPVSTRTSLSPVLTSHSLTEVAIVSFGRKALSNRLAALSASPENNLVSSGTQPSLSTVTSK